MGVLILEHFVLSSFREGGKEMGLLDQHRHCCLTAARVHLKCVLCLPGEVQRSGNLAQGTRAMPGGLCFGQPSVLVRDVP